MYISGASAAAGAAAAAAAAGLDHNSKKHIHDKMIPPKSYKGTKDLPFKCERKIIIRQSRI